MVAPIGKLARWLTICAILKSPHPIGKPWTSQRIADELGLSVDTVGRELDALCDLGAPIVGAGADTRSGWVLGEWDFWEAVRSEVEELSNN
jgi:HTH domain